MAVYADFVTSEGDFTIRLFDKDLPNPVANFVGLTEESKDGRTRAPIRRARSRPATASSSTASSTAS